MKFKVLKMKKIIAIYVALLILITTVTEGSQSQKHKIFIVSSYHREYLWSQDTQKGLCDAMVKFGFLDNKEQADKFTKNDYVESSSVVIKKVWMDTKHKNTRSEIAATVNKVVQEISEFLRL